MNRDPISVLLVEDNPGDARLVHEMLSKLSFNRFEIIHADRLSRALELLEIKRPDVILLDLTLPDTHGLGTFTAVRDASPSVSVIVMSGLNDEEIAVSAVQEGAQDYLVKGQVDAGLLVRSIRYSIERKKAEERTQHSYRTLQIVLDSMPYGVVIVGKDRTIHYVNSAVLELTENRLGEDMVGRRCDQVFCSPETCDCSFIDHSEGEVRSEQTVVTKSGARIPVLKTVVPIELKGEPLLLEAFVDITDIKYAEQKLKEHEKQLEYLADHDTLTGLPNRRLFHRCLSRHLAQARRNAHSLAIMLLDLDHFKTINDSLGHAAGDLLLKLVAERMRCTLRKSDMVARLGGDEFTVLLPHVQSPDDVLRIVAKLKKALEPPFEVEGEEFYLTSSIGVAIFPDDGQDMVTLVKNADMAMYRAKEQGRNSHRLYSPEMHGVAMERMVLKNSLHKALERNEFILHYQPQVELKTGRIKGMEALVRWRHKEFGLIPPAKFITLAEETGLIIPIGEWVLRSACRQNMNWKKNGFDPGTMAVNLSVRQFRQVDLPAVVERILGETGMMPGELELEITESSLIYDVKSAVSTLKRLHGLGVRISIDDFGTGYSCLNYLKELPIHTLKIDRSFVMELDTGSNDETIVRAIIALAHSLRIKVVAEGIETPRQQEFLFSLGCETGQGYLFSRPIPPEEVEKLFSRGVSR